MLLRSPAWCAPALVLVLAGSTSARAQTGVSLNRAGSGARAAGMGDAFIAVSDDGTAASWNPAGLAQLRQPELSLVYVVSDRSLRLSGLRSPDELTAYSTRRLNYANGSLDFASAAVPFAIASTPVTLQVGWHRLYHLSGDFSGDIERFQTSRLDIPTASVSLEDRVVGDIDVFSLAAAVKLTSRTALGASFDLWRGDWTERVSLVETPSQGTSAFLTNNSSQRLRGRSATVGLLLTYPSWNAGLVYHAPFWSSFRVQAESHSTRAESLRIDLPGVRFRLPRSIGAGLAWRPAPRWTAALALTHDQWTDALVDGFPGTSGPINFFDQAPPELSTTRDTLSLNVGVEHLLLREGSVVPLRLGFGWEPQGAMDPVTRDPVDYRLVTAGAGYNTNRFKFDAAVQYRWASFRGSNVLSVNSAITEGFVADAIGRANTHEWRVKVSAIYRIPDTDKLRGLIRRILG